MYSNIDINTVCTPFLEEASKLENFSEEALYPFVDAYIDTQVTDILFCIFCQSSVTDSKVWTDYADKYLTTEENGEKVDYKKFFSGLYKINKEYGIDPYEVWIKRCKQIGRKAWISVRMNDCHKANWIRSDFFRKARENNWLVGDKYGYFEDCFNYRVDEVRRIMLRYIEEQIQRYDVDGLELDFMREIFCFDYLEDNMDECVAIMNDFMRSVKKLVESAEKKHGHKIRIGVKLNRDIDQALAFGFDARTWAKENLVDLIVPSPRWASSDSLIPINQWKKELKGIEIAGGMELLIGWTAQGYPYMTPETARGVAAGILSDGADKVYLYNFFDCKTERDTEIQKTCADLDEIYKHKVRCPVICQEGNSCPKGFKPWKPLPMELSKGQKKSVDIRTGKVPADKKKTIMFGLEKGELTNDFQVLFNGEPVTGFAMCEIPEPKTIVPEHTKCYFAAVEPGDSITQTIEFVCGEEEALVNWIELDIE